MSVFAKIYTDEDVAGLVETLLNSRGISATSTPEQRQLGKSDEEQLAFATSIECCNLTHNRVDYEALHLQSVESGRSHGGIMIAPRKNPYEIVQRAMILLSALTVDEISDQLLYL